jgi:hypothetical protein
MERRFPFPFRWYRIATFAGCITSTASCSSLVDSLAYDERPIPADVVQVPVQREAVVPALLPSIDENGLLRFPTPTVPRDEMPLDTAVAQAGEFLFYALNIVLYRSGAESERGAFIDLPTLAPCNRPQLTRSVFETPPDTLIPAIRLQLGGRWTIPFCGTRRTPEVIVSVATLSNGARFQNSRPVGDTLNQLLAFRVNGIRWEWTAEHMVTAEEAVNEAYAVTGVRVARVPELVAASQINGRPAGYVVCPVWRLTLERPVRMGGFYSQRLLDLSEVYVADSDCPGVIGRTILLTPWREQPTSREFAVVVRDPTSPDGFRRHVYVATYKAPVAFESVIMVR